MQSAVFVGTTENPIRSVEGQRRFDTGVASVVGVCDRDLVSVGLFDRGPIRVGNNTKCCPGPVQFHEPMLEAAPRRSGQECVHGSDVERRIVSAADLPSRMHRQLCDADVDRRDPEPRRGDRSDRGTTRQI